MKLNEIPKIGIQFFFVAFICLGCGREKLKIWNGRLEITKQDKVKSIAFKKDEQSTIFFRFDSAGNLITIVHKKGLQMDGASYTFYPNGRIKNQCYSKNGVIDGDTNSFSDK